MTFLAVLVAESEVLLLFEGGTPSTTPNNPVLGLLFVAVAFLTAAVGAIVTVRVVRRAAGFRQPAERLEAVVRPAVDEPTAESTPSPTPADGTGPTSYWVLPPPEPPPSNRRIGWLVVWLGVGAIAIFAAYLATGIARSDPNDGGSADVAFVVSPILAAMVALVTGLLLAIVAKLRLVGLSVARAIRAMAIGVIGGPVIYLVVLIPVSFSTTLTRSMTFLGLLMFVVPAICGVGVTLISARVRPT